MYWEVSWFCGRSGCITLKWLWSCGIRNPAVSFPCFRRLFYSWKIGGQPLFCLSCVSGRSFFMTPRCVSIRILFATWRHYRVRKKVVVLCDLQNRKLGCRAAIKVFLRLWFNFPTTQILCAVLTIRQPRYLPIGSRSCSQVHFRLQRIVSNDLIMFFSATRVDMKRSVSYLFTT